MGDAEVDDELEIEVLLYPGQVDLDEQRRAFVFEHLANGEIDGHILAANCHLLCEWLKTGCVPEQPKVKRAAALKTV